MSSNRFGARIPCGDALSVADIQAVQLAITGVVAADLDPDSTVDEVPADDAETSLMQIRALEELKNAISARQADLSVRWAEHQRARDIARNQAISSTAEAARCGAVATRPLTTRADLQARRHVDPAATTRVVGSQIGIARRVSPDRGARLATLAHVLVDELPHTFHKLRAGVISEWQAAIVARETTHLSAADRAQIDVLIQDELGTASERRLQDVTREHAYRLDPEAAVHRRAKAENNRYVSLRPAPDAMTWLSALLPVKDGVGIYAALTAAANQPATDADDRRGRGQRMADALVHRVTGRPACLAPTTAEKTGDKHPAPVAVNLLVPLDTLTGNAPAHLDGYGPIPADLAHQFLADAGEKIRRMFQYPGTGDLIAMESKARHYPGLLAAFTRLRDQHCRGPYCGAPIRHIDHVTPHAAGGKTSERNAAGVCERCNQTKEHPDYNVSGHAGETVTSTGGLQHTSRPPAPPGQPPPVDSALERVLIIRNTGLTIEFDPAA